MLKVRNNNNTNTEFTERFRRLKALYNLYINGLSRTTSWDGCWTDHDHHDHVLWCTLNCYTGIRQLSLSYRYTSVVCPLPRPVRDFELTVVIMTTSRDGRWTDRGHHDQAAIMTTWRDGCWTVVQVYVSCLRALCGTDRAGAKDTCYTLRKLEKRCGKIKKTTVHMTASELLSRADCS